MQRSRTGSNRWLVLLGYVVMVGVNALANILPINGVTTGEVSDRYFNLFAPAPLTFSIWGVIYILLGIYVVATLAQKDSGLSPARTARRERINGYFFLSCLANAGWIFAWHYGQILLTLLLMLALLGCLLVINRHIVRMERVPGQGWTLRVPFSVYFGWITVATIANVTALLVAWDWSGWGIDPELWTVLVLAVGVFIGALTTLRRRDSFYGAVILWAYGGILLRHTSATGFDGAYPLVVLAVGACLVVMLVVEGFALLRRRKEAR